MFLWHRIDGSRLLKFTPEVRVSSYGLCQHFRLWAPYLATLLHVTLCLCFVLYSYVYVRMCAYAYVIDVCVLQYMRLCI